MDVRIRRQAVDLYDQFTHEGVERRAFMAKMVAIAASPVAAAIIAELAFGEQPIL